MPSKKTTQSRMVIYERSYKLSGIMVAIQVCSNLAFCTKLLLKKKSPRLQYTVSSETSSNWSSVDGTSRLA